MLYVIVVGWILLSEGSVVRSAMKVAGHVGGSVRIPCSHSFASTNTKYFCRYPCTDTDILIRSDKSSSGRHRLEDGGKGVFTVTITDLQKSDAGTYWCAVERWGTDTFTQVILRVADAPPPPPHGKNPPKASPATAPMRTSRSEEPPSFSSNSTISNSTPPTISPSMSKPVNVISHIQSSGGFTATLLYTVAGLVSIVIIFGLSLIALYCKRKRTTIEPQSPVLSCSIYSDVKKPKSSPNMSTSFTEQSDEDTLENPLYDSLGTEMETVYSQIYAIAQ